MLRNPCSFSGTWPQPRMTFYGPGPSGEPSKPRMSVHNRSFTGETRPTPSNSRAQRRQSPLTASSRRTSSMLIQNRFHHRPHHSLWTTVTRPGLPGDTVVSAGWGWCGGHRGLAHPRSQDSLLPTRHLINTESDSRVECPVEKFQSVCGCDGQWVQQASGRQYTVCTRRNDAYVCVLCVGNYIPTTTTAENTKFFSY